MTILLVPRPESRHGELLLQSASGNPDRSDRTSSFVGFCWLGCIFVRPFLRVFVRSREDTNSIVGHVVSAFGVFYGLLLGLIAVASYQNLAKVEDNVAREVAALDALYQDVGTYPAPYGQNLRWLLRDYCRYVFKYAWDDYERGEIPTGEQTRITAFHERLLAFEPETESQKYCSCRDDSPVHRVS